MLEPMNLHGVCCLLQAPADSRRREGSHTGTGLLSVLGGGGVEFWGREGFLGLRGLVGMEIGDQTI